MHERQHLFVNKPNVAMMVLLPAKDNFDVDEARPHTWTTHTMYTRLIQGFMRSSVPSTSDITVKADRDKTSRTRRYVSSPLLSSPYKISPIIITFVCSLVLARFSFLILYSRCSCYEVPVAVYTLKLIRVDKH